MLLVGKVLSHEWKLTIFHEGHAIQMDFNQQDLLGVDSLNVVTTQPNSLTLAQEVRLNIHAKSFE